MSSRILIAILFGFLSGVAIGTLYTPSLPVVVFLLLISVGLGVIWRKNSTVIFSPQLLLITLCLLSLSVGLLRVELAASQFGISPLASSVGSEVELTGVVTKEPDKRERSLQLYVEVGADTLLVSTDRLASIQYGDEIRFTGILKEPEPFTTDLGRTFDYPKYLLVRGIEYQVSFADTEVIQSGQANPVISWLLEQKQRLVSGIQKGISEPAAGLGVGLLLGVKQGLGEEIEAAFRRTGIIHIVVLSGYNVMLIVAFVMTVLSLFLPKKPRVIFGVLAIVSFALLVGLSPTVVRASIMACLLLIAQAYSKTYDVMRTLLIAGVAMIVINPYLLLYDIGFQLSFMATLGLILVAPQFESMAATLPNKIGVRDFFIATIATQIAVLPLLLYHIGEVSLISVVVNVLVLPMVPVAMLLTFIASVAGIVFPLLVPLVAGLAHLSLSYIISVATYFATVPFAAITVPYFSPYWIPVLYGVMGIVLYWLYQPKQPVVAQSLQGWVIEEES